MKDEFMQELLIDKSDWKPVKFGDVVFEPKEAVKGLDAAGIQHVVGLEHIDSGDIHLRRSAGIEDETTFTKKFTKGDVLFGRRRAYLKKAACADYDGICSGDIIVMRAKQELLMPKLLPFLVNNDSFFDYAIQHSAGGLSPRVKFKDLANYELLLPPKEQQEEIAELFWAMDDVVETERRIISTFSDSVASIFREALTDYDRSISLADVGEIITGTTPSTKKKEYWEGGGVPFITPADFRGEPYIKNVGREITDAGLRAVRVLPENTVLVVSIGATIGKVAIANERCATNQQINAVIVREGFSSVYVMLALKFFNHRILARAGATTLPIINKGEFSKVRIPFVSSSRVETLESKFAALESARQASIAKVSYSKSLQKSLIDQVF